MKKLFSILSFALIAIITASCGSTHAGSDNDLLVSGNWQLTSMNKKSIVASEFTNGAPVANFSIDHKITGNSGCNRYGGAYNLNTEGGINISEVISTKMACPSLKGESEYLDALSKVNMAKIDKDQLILLHDTEELLVYKHIE